jgi:AAA domain
MNLDELQALAVDNVTHVELYGPPKVGKSVIAGILANYGFRLHWCDLERGIKVLFGNDPKGKPWLTAEGRKNVNYLNIPDHQNYPIAITTLKEIVKGGMKKVCFNHGAINCAKCAAIPGSAYSEIDLTKFTPRDILVIDSITQLGMSAINKAVQKELQKQGENYKFEWDDYRVQGYALDNIFNMIQVMPVNVICISHEIDTEKDDKSPEKIAPAAGTRNHSKTASKFFDELVYCHIMNGKHRITNSTTFSSKVQSGGRSGLMLDALPELSILPLFRPETYELLKAGKEVKIDWAKEGL